MKQHTFLKVNICRKKTTPATEASMCLKRLRLGALGRQEAVSPTVGLLRERLRLLWERRLAREWLLEGSAEAGGEAVGGGVPEARRHAHGAGAKRRCSREKYQHKVLDDNLSVFKCKAAIHN